MNSNFLRKWKEFYVLVNRKGAFINECKAMGVFNDSPKEYEMLDEELRRITTQCSKFLNNSGYAMPPTPWEYDKDNPSTWPSHPTFAYAHLLPK